MAWNGSGSAGGSAAPQAPKKKSGASSPLWLKGALAGILVVAICAAVLYMTRPANEKPLVKTQEVNNAKTIISVDPAPVAPKVAVVRDTPKPKVVQLSPKFQSLRDKQLTQEQIDELYEKQLAEQKIPNVTNRTFSTGLEQVMGWIFTTRLGEAPPPLPEISDFDLVHFDEILNRKNEISEKDSDKDADSKETVDAVKKELREFVAKGGDPQEFLSYYHEVLNEAYSKWQIAQTQLDKVLEEDPSLAVDFARKVNKSLAKEGIRGVEISDRDRDRYEISDEIDPEADSQTDEEGGNE